MKTIKQRQREASRRAQLTNAIWSHIPADLNGYGDMIDTLMSHVSEPKLRRILLHLKMENSRCPFIDEHCHQCVNDTTLCEGEHRASAYECAKGGKRWRNPERRRRKAVRS